MNYQRAGKIMIAIGIAVMIAFIVILIISARRQKAGLDPIVPSTFPNPFSAGVAQPRPQPNTPGQSIDQGTATNPGIVVKPLDPLLQLTTFPVTNYALLQNPDGSSFVRTNAKDVGYIYDVIGTENPKLVQQTTTLIQDIGDIGYGAGGEVFARYYDDQAYRYEAFFGMLEDSLSRVVCTTQFPIKPKLGDSGQSIEKLQLYLSEYLKQKPLVSPGVFDAATRQMVIDFQKSQKLTADGSLGAKSITALEQICTQSEKTARAQKMAESNTPRYVLSGRPQIGEVHNMVANPSGTKFFYIKTTIDGIRGYVRSLVPVGIDKEIYQLPFAEWNTAWVDDTRISLTTRPAGSVTGYAYFIDVATGAMTKLFDAIPGMTTLFHSSGTLGLVGRTVSNSYSLEFVTLSATTAPNFEKTGLASFPEKCAFMHLSNKALCMVPESLPTALYPDEWYQSLVSLTDSLWEVTPTPLRKRQLDTFSADDTPRYFDAVSLRVSKDDRYLYFIDQKTGFLWRYDLTLAR